jgi:hypothetical protein
MRAAATPTVSEIAPPASTRTSTLRPRPSVPSQARGQAWRIAAAAGPAVASRACSPERPAAEAMRST